MIYTDTTAAQENDFSNHVTPLPSPLKIQSYHALDMPEFGLNCDFRLALKADRVEYFEGRGCVIPGLGFLLDPNRK